MEIKIWPFDVKISTRSPIDEPGAIKEYENMLPQGLSEKGQTHWIAARNLANDLAGFIQLEYPSDRNAHADFYIHSYLLRESADKRINGDKHSSYSSETKSIDLKIINDHEDKVEDETFNKIGIKNPEVLEAVKLNAQQIAHRLNTQTHQTPHDELATRRIITSSYNALITYLYPASPQVNKQVV